MPAVTFAGLAAVAALICFVLTPLVARLAARLSVVDEPRGRHLHGRTVPLLGGVAIALSIVATLAFSYALDVASLQRLLTVHGDRLLWLSSAALLVLGLGIADDMFEVGAPAKVAVQTIAATIVVLAGYGFVAITNPVSGGYIHLGALGPLITIVWIVGITNSFNLIDGLDGLAAGVALIATLTLIGVALLDGRSDSVVVWSVLAGTLFGFLPYNFPPASIFLGDSGSMFLGFSLAVISIQSLEKGATTVVLAVPILTLGLPISDTAHAVARRWLVSGLSAVARADREHIHHRLLRSGYSTRAAVLILYVSCAVFSAFAFLAVVARGATEALLVAVAAAVAFAATKLLGVRADRHTAADDYEGPR